MKKYQAQSLISPSHFSFDSLGDEDEPPRRAACTPTALHPIPPHSTPRHPTGTYPTQPHSSLHPYPTRSLNPSFERGRSGPLGFLQFAHKAIMSPRDINKREGRKDRSSSHSRLSPPERDAKRQSHTNSSQNSHASSR